MRKAIERIRRRCLYLGFGAAVGLSACGGDSGPPTGPGGGTPTVASIAVTPDSLDMTFLGETRQLAAEPRDAAGNKVAVQALTWTSGTPDVATVTANGQLRAIGNGTTVIRVTSGQVVGEAAIRVAQVASSVSVSGTPDFLLGAGSTASLVAEARDAGNQPVAGESITWTSSAVEIVTVGADGLLTAVAHGDATITASTAGGVTGTAPVGVVATSGSGVESIDREMAGFLRRWDVPGLTMAVVVDGRLVVARGLGLADAVSGEPMRPDHLLRIASVTKPITSAAIVRLVQDGSLDLDDRVFPDRLPGLWAAAQPVGDSRLGDMTVRNVLNHQSGWNAFVSGSLDPMFASRAIATSLGVPSPPEAPDVIRFMLGRPLDFTPGTSVAYSNFGYSVLARVIENAGGTDYETWVRQNILEPAGAGGMRLGKTLEEDRLPGEVRYHTLGLEVPMVPSVFGPNPTPVPWPYGGFYLTPMDGHGGWVGSAVDLVRFALGVDGRGGDDVISAASRSLLESDLVPLGGGQYGYGWFVDGDGSWHHTGRLPGSASRLVIRSSGVSYAVLLNGSSSPEGPFLNDLVGTLNTTIAATTWPDVDLFPDY